MKKVIALLALLLAATNATAATYYVSATGSGSNSGADAAHPWDLAKANSTLASGDVAILANGNYGSAIIAPAASGSNYASARVSYVGNLTNPSAVVVGGISLVGASYVSIKGVRAAGNLSLATTRDSIYGCVFPSGMLKIAFGGNDNVIAGCTFAGDMWAVTGIQGGLNCSTSPYTPVLRDTINDNVFDITHSGVGQAGAMFYMAEGIVMNRCQFNITVTSTGNNGTFKIYDLRSSRIIDNNWTITSQRAYPQSGCDECNVSYYRDYTINNLFQRDTLNFTGSNQLVWFASASGSCAQTTGGNRWDSCVIRNSTPYVTGQTSGMMWFQNGMRTDTLTNCVLVGDGAAPTFYENNVAQATPYLDHNTFISLGAQSAFSLEGLSVGHTVTNNIFYSRATARAVDVGGSGTQTFWDSDKNLYYTAGAASSAMRIAGTTYPAGASALCTTWSAECSSQFGDPLFVGGATAATFDAHVSASSPAGTFGDGGYVGAYNPNAETTHTITVTQPGNGSISPGTTAVADNGSQTFTITPGAGYRISYLTVDGSNVSSASTYTFSNVTTTHTLTATMVADTYTISSQAFSNGSISPDGNTTVNGGNSQYYAISANSNYAVLDVLVDGASVGAVVEYLFSNVRSDHTIEAYFKLSTSYTITATAGAGGTISPAGNTAVASGASQAYTITAATGYTILDVLVDGVSVGAVSSYTFTNVTAAHTIAATFVLTNPSIITIISDNANGTIYPAGTLDGRKTNYIQIIPAPFHRVSAVYVNGVNVGAVTSYTIPVQTVSAATVYAEFTPYEVHGRRTRRYGR